MCINLDSILKLETISLGGWPAIEEEEYDCWILRASCGYTGRANSIVPLHKGNIDIHEKILNCESWYGIRGLPAIFKLTDASDYLSGYLDKRLYSIRPRVNVQSILLNGFNRKSDIILSEMHVDEWIDAYRTIVGQSESELIIHSNLLRLLQNNADFVVLFVDNAPVCCGICVYQGEYAGIFDIVTASAVRRKGYAEQLLIEILNIAKNKGASYSYLQVISDNKPAISLYRKLGFETQYQYWYRYQQRAE